MKGLRVLYVAVSQGHLAVFHKPYLRWLRSEGATVDIAARAVDGFQLPDVGEFHDITFDRNPFSLGNFRSLMRLVRIARRERYDILHCHTPVASALTRLAGPFAKGRPIIMYTAHGFHFFPGAPRRNWCIWFTLEWLLSRLTDLLVTINRWDYDAARTKLRARRARLVPGVGVELAKFSGDAAIARAAIRAEFAIPSDAVVLVYIAEFIPRKNHAFLVRAFSEIVKKEARAVLVLAGDGPLIPEIEQMIKSLGLSRNVRLAGFRRDIPELVSASDIAVSTSRQEGLGIGLAEGMAGGLPVVASEDRGHRELVIDQQTGFLIRQEDLDGFVARTCELIADPGLRLSMGAAGREHVVGFGLDSALAAMVPIYREAAELARMAHKRGGAS
jgi:glycosyltransferase EpsD